MVDRFSNKKPQYISPRNEYETLTKPPERNNLPAKPLKDQKHDFKVYELLEQAKQLSNTMAAKYVVASNNNKHRETLKEAKEASPSTYCQAHIIESDAIYVETVRSMKITDKGGMALLLANGGSEYLQQGFTAAQAFDLLRNERMKKLLPQPGKSFDKRASIDGKGYVAGIMNEEDRRRKVLQSRVKDE